MKKIIILILLVSNIFLYADKAEEILKKYNNSIIIPNLYGEFSVTLISVNGDKREIKAKAYQKFSDNLQMSRLFMFDYPPSVRDTGLLIHSYYQGKGENKMWIYLPLVKKIKRISLNSSGGGYFMGSDFSYSDLISKSSTDFIQEYIGEGEINGITYDLIKEYGDTDEKKELLGYKHIIN
ncbi:MAG: outer membrane lipoprotein-sorting protein, partial [Spirochaetales bacterium]|nr:outer membrane lipoprotein-sorting protein [Spirochaetales bacterium]